MSYFAVFGFLHALFVDGGNFFIMGKVSYNRIGTRFLMGFKLFWKVLEKNILNCVLHVKYDYFSHFEPIMLLFFSLHEVEVAYLKSQS